MNENKVDAGSMKHAADMKEITHNFRHLHFKKSQLWLISSANIKLFNAIIESGFVYVHKRIFVQ